MDKQEISRRAGINKEYREAKKALHAVYTAQLYALNHLRQLRISEVYQDRFARIGRRKIIDDYDNRMRQKEAT